MLGSLLREVEHRSTCQRGGTPPYSSLILVLSLSHLSKGKDKDKGKD
jgi:hypothetical protein